MTRGQAERLWSVVPAAAAVLCSRASGRAGPADQDPLGSPRWMPPWPSAAPNLEAILGGKAIPRAQVGQFGPDAERMARAAPLIKSRPSGRPPPSCRRLCSTPTPGPPRPGRCSTRAGPRLAGAARDATLYRPLRRAPGERPPPTADAAAQIAARRHPDGKGGGSRCPPCPHPWRL